MFKSVRNKVLAVLGLVAVLFGSGVYVGYDMPRNIDPQDYIQTSFMPYDSGIDTYVQFLGKARRSVRVAIYSLSDPRVTDKLLELHQNGVKDIKLLLDKSQTVARSGQYEQAQIKRLRDVGIEVVIGTSEQKHNIMHLKMTIIDGVWVEDGSWNYTKSANSQANDINIIKSPRRAALFQADWDRMYAFMRTQNQTPWIKEPAPGAAIAAPAQESEPEPNE